MFHYEFQDQNHHSTNFWYLHGHHPCKELCLKPIKSPISVLLSWQANPSHGPHCSHHLYTIPIWPKKNSNTMKDCSCSDNLCSSRCPSTLITNWICSLWWYMKTACTCACIPEPIWYKRYILNILKWQPRAIPNSFVTFQSKKILNWFFKLPVKLCTWIRNNAQNQAAQLTLSGHFICTLKLLQWQGLLSTVSSVDCKPWTGSNAKYPPTYFHCVNTIHWASCIQHQGIGAVLKNKINNSHTP